MIVDAWLVRLSRNYAFLRRAVDSAGSALAKQPYESFLQPGTELSFAEFIDGVEVHFSADIYRVDTDGTLWVAVDAAAQLSTPLRIRPVYVFKKLPDGRAFRLRSFAKLH
jgi:hypothetical protein